MRETEGLSKEEAKRHIKDFVQDEDFETLDDKPRIMLVAGAFEDQHLTSAVLWLSKFSVDITCVELTPYRLSGSKKLAMVAKVIIPLPEAKQYLIKVKEKELVQGELSPPARLYQQRNQQILRYFRELMPEKAPISAPARQYMQIKTGRTGVHYEWWQQARSKELAIGLHFESGSKKANRKWCEHFRKRRGQIEKAVGQKMNFDLDWGEKWAKFDIGRSGQEWSDEMARWAAQKMQALISVTQPIVQSFRP